MRRQVFREEGKCRRCGMRPSSGRLRGSGFVIDHIVPIAQGGRQFDRANLQLLCSECNKRKTREDLRRLGGSCAEMLRSDEEFYTGMDWDTETLRWD